MINQIKYNILNGVGMLKLHKPEQSKYLIIFTAILLLTFSVQVNSQNWIVGQAINKHITTININGGGCYPAIDVKFDLPANVVQGVHYKMIIQTATASGIVLFPLNDTLVVGDTITLANAPGNYSVYFSNGGGNLVIEVRAIGTPIVAGEAHPCSSSDAWSSDFLSCPETISFNLVSACHTVISGVGIEDLSGSDRSIKLPDYSNNYQLSFGNASSIKGCRITDSKGALLTWRSASDLGTGLVSCASFKTGIYFLEILYNDNSKSSLKMPILR
ncbi:MAG: hypothetical protein WCO63_12140 [Bacteroidota bacterium]